MTELVEAALFPDDAYLRMQLLETLCSGNQGWQSTTVVPGNSPQTDATHSFGSSKFGIRTSLPLLAETQAASITSIAATPSDAGDRLHDGSRIESMRLIAGARCG